MGGIWRGAVMVVFALAAPVAAQDGSEGGVNRSPAGAVRFLSATAKQNKIGLAVDNNSATAQINIGVADFVPESDCVTRLEVQQGGVFFEFGTFSPSLSGGVDRPEDAAKFDAFLVRHGLARPPYLIEWGKVTDLVRADQPCPSCVPDGKFNILRFQGKTLFFPDSRTGDRAEFAMKFLVEKCGVPDNEGF